MGALKNIIKIYKIICNVNEEKLYRNIFIINNKTIHIYNYFMKLRLSIKLYEITSFFNFDNNTSDVDKIIKINNYMKNNIILDKAYSAHLDPKEKVFINRKILKKRTAYSAFIFGKAACSGFAEGLRILLKYYNIKSDTLLVAIPLKPINKEKYYLLNKSYYYDSLNKLYYPKSIYKNIEINNNLYKGFAHFSTIVYINDLKIIVDPDRQGDRERKNVDKDIIINEIKVLMKYVFNIPSNYDPITSKLLGTAFDNLNCNYVNLDCNTISIMEIS